MTDSPDFAPAIYPDGRVLSQLIDSHEHSEDVGLKEVLLDDRRESESHEDSLEKKPRTPSSPPPPPAKEYYCGVGKCHPRWLQVFQHAKFFTFLLCLFCFVQGALVSGFTSVILSTIERRYRFSSTAAGFIASTYDMAVLVSVLFISYFGGKGHKPRWLGFSLVVMGIGSLVFALPEFVFGSYDVGVRGSARLESCQDGFDFSPECSQSNVFAYTLFIVGNVIVGVGAASLFTVGTSYIDDIVHPKWVPVHIGVFQAVSIFGPAMGYGLGGAFLSIYVDPWLETNLDPSDPGWVGAWWLCFVFIGVVSIIISIPFFLFPRLLPDSHLVKMERDKEMAKSYKSKYGRMESTSLLAVLKTFPIYLMNVLCNLVWVFITLAITCALLVVSGMTAFAPKYLESQFELTTSTASLLVGAVSIPTGGAGVITGALSIYFTKSKGHQVSFIHATISFFLIIPMLMFLVHCPTLNLAGVTVSYPDGSLSANLSSTCNLNCNCTSTVFEPVCGADGLSYFSPCRAGCDKYFPNGGAVPVFENCSCIAKRLQDLPAYSNTTYTYADVLGNNSTATDGICNQGCNQLGLFLGLVAVTLFLVFMLYTPNALITLRCVAEEQRTLALGLQSVIFRGLGTVPGPILFGVIFDSACIYWQYECSRRGNCWVYDNIELSRRALTLAMAGVFANFIFSFLCWIAYWRGKHSDTEG